MLLRRETIQKSLAPHLSDDLIDHIVLPFAQNGVAFKGIVKNIIPDLRFPGHVTSFYNPKSNDDQLFVSLRSTVQVCGSLGNKITKFDLGSLPLGCENPRGVAINTRQNHLYVADENHRKILVFDITTGKPLNNITRKSFNPFGVSYDANNNLIVVSELIDPKVSILNGAQPHQLIRCIKQPYLRLKSSNSALIHEVTNKIYVADLSGSAIWICSNEGHYIKSINISSKQVGDMALVIYDDETGEYKTQCVISNWIDSQLNIVDDDDSIIRLKGFYRPLGLTWTLSRTLVVCDNWNHQLQCLQ